MLRETIAPNHILVFAKVSPQDLLDLNTLNITTSNRIQKQT